MTDFMMGGGDNSADNTPVRYAEPREGLIRAGELMAFADKPGEREGYVVLTVAEYQRLLACERLATAIREMRDGSSLCRARGIFRLVLPPGDDCMKRVARSTTPEAAMGIEEDK